MSMMLYLAIEGIGHSRTKARHPLNPWNRRKIPSGHPERIVCVCHEHIIDVRNYMKDEGKRLLEVALQEEISNHLKLLWSKAKVVSVKEKV
ncbi:hypothetical protein DB41_BW00030 [Neochlamydia sp. TUME1]|nr:hypothetical protein DB41_BW00030 [Neochlamydia sp. TUME1]